jgi:hypothetical protein
MEIRLFHIKKLLIVCDLELKQTVLPASPPLVAQLRKNRWKNDLVVPNETMRCYW